MQKSCTAFHQQLFHYNIIICLFKQKLRTAQNDYSINQSIFIQYFHQHEINFRMIAGYICIRVYAYILYILIYLRLYIYILAPFPSRSHLLAGWLAAAYFAPLGLANSNHRVGPNCSQWHRNSTSAPLLNTIAFVCVCSARFLSSITRFSIFFIFCSFSTQSFNSPKSNGQLRTVLIIGYGERSISFLA